MENKSPFFPLYIIWYREILLYFRNTLKFFTSIFAPLLILIFFGTGLQTIFPTDLLNYNFVQFFFPGILGLSCIVMVLSSTISIVWDKEFGFLKEMLVAPVKRYHIALGKILGATTTALIEGFLILLVSPYLGINLSLKVFFESLGLIFLISFGVGSLGLYLASRLSRVESFSILTQLVIAPMVFLSGAFYSLKNAPLWMVKIAYFNPLAYGIDALRWSILSLTFPQEKLLELTLFSFNEAVMFLVAFDILLSFLALGVFKRYLR
ncbi:MAG: ABC transporter permease [Candidatus Paceibacterota bacterium]